MRDASNNLRPGKVPGTGVARRAPIEGNLRWRRDSELYMSDPRASFVPNVVEVVDVQVREVHEVRDMPPAPEIDGPPPR